MVKHSLNEASDLYEQVKLVQLQSMYTHGYILYNFCLECASLPHLHMYNSYY